MILNHQDLTWDVPSPSFWKLVGFPVDIDFLGDGWYLFCADAGHVTTCRFPSRDAAIGMVQKVFKKVQT